MDDACVGALFVLCPRAGFGTPGVLGVVVGDAGLSVLTVCPYGSAWRRWSCRPHRPLGANYGASGAET